jgi:hypothetical protein
MPSLPDSSSLKSVQSLSDQFTKSFSSSVSQVSGAVDGFLKSAPTSVSDAIGNVNKAASLLGAAGLSAKASVSQALNQLGSLGSYSKFTDSFPLPSKLKDLTPEETSRSKLRYLGGLTFPENLGEYYMIFTFKAYQRTAPLIESKALPLQTINLPIPTNLQEQFGMQYSDKQLGIAGAIEENIRNSGGSFGSAEEIGKSVGEGIKRLSASGSEAAFYGVRAVAGLSDSVGGAIDTATGAVLNPFQSLVFQGVNLRSHSFTYRFSPNSQRESDTLKEIIYEFKRRMHPEKTKLFLNFPDIVDIKFGKKDGEPYFFTTCFLESMSLNYAPQGTPSFFSESSTPVEVEMTLNFKEIKPITRGDIPAPKSTSTGASQRGELGPN